MTYEQASGVNNNHFYQYIYINWHEVSKYFGIMNIKKYMT